LVSFGGSRGNVNLASGVCSSRPLIGVLGGAGPLASSAFLASVYEGGVSDPEQDQPRILLLSDPSLDDRTAMLRTGQRRRLAEAVRVRLEQLEAGGAQFLILCCFTAHAVVPFLPSRLQERLVRLPDVALGLVAKRRESTLVLCTEGARLARLFESSPLWSDVACHVEFPDAMLQEHVHDLIYQLKTGLSPERGLNRLETVLGTGSAGALLCGCTEFHLLSRARRTSTDLSSPAWIDPLEYLALAIRDGRLADTVSGLGSVHTPGRLPGY